jgi:hypothetical protein
MKKLVSMLMAVAISLGSMAFAENQAPDKDFAPDANPNVNPPTGAVQDPGGVPPPPRPTFEQWVEGGKKIPPEMVFTGGSPIFDESTGKNRSDEEVYKMCFPEIVICFPEPGTGGPDPVAEYKHVEKLIAEKKEKAKRNRFTEKGEEQFKKELAELENRLAELKKIPEVVICIFPPKPERKPFPPHWGKPPPMQTKDFRPLPGNFGPENGSSTLCAWVERNINADLANKDKPKPQTKRPPMVLDAKPPRDELPVEVESDKKALMEEMKAKLASLEGASREDTRKAFEEFKEDNEARFAAIKKVADAQKELERPERRSRPAPPLAVKERIAEVKKVEKTMHVARKAVTDKLKEAQDELAAKIAEAKENPDKNEVEIHIKTLVAEQAAARKAALNHFRSAQKEKHEELKAAQKELREEVRNTKEKGSSRTSR